MTRTTLLVGGGSGIGRTNTVAAAARGAAVILASGNTDTLAKVASEIGQSADIRPVDLTDETGAIK
ncbi:MAG: SDR family NAD(P)-dependent oxidoreductase [Pseudomonadota bacterium]